MAYNIFISFRFSDGKDYKNELSKLFEDSESVIDYSEDKDRSNMSDDSIKEYLYNKIKRTSITIVILTPFAVKHEKNIWGKYDDWMYDEIRFSLEDRENNRSNGLIAIYTESAKKDIILETTHKCSTCNKESSATLIYDFDNLVRKNMMNVKNQYKVNPCEGLFDSDLDSYISLVSFESFKKDVNKHLDYAITKRDERYKYNLIKRL